MYVIKLLKSSQPCWFDGENDGDPSRTLLLSSAKHYETFRLAKEALAKLEREYPGREYEIEADDEPARQTLRVSNGTERLITARSIAKEIGMTFRRTDRKIDNYRAYEIVDKKTKQVLGEYTIPDGAEALSKLYKERS